jgi:hypothetical protein
MKIGGVVGLALAGALLGVSACAVRLGGPAPEQYHAVALRASEDAAAVGGRLRAAGADIVLLAADRDSAWFALVAQHAQLSLSGPGRTGTSGLALLTDLKILGDTALVLPVEGGGELHMQDALYEIDKNRHLDLMLVRMDPAAGLRESVRALLGYIATDVGGTASVLLALETATPQRADSAALLLRAAFEQANECRGEGPGEAAAAQTLRLFYGPTARIDCRSARLLEGGTPAPTVARVVVRG